MNLEAVRTTPGYLKTKDNLKPTNYFDELLQESDNLLTTHPSALNPSQLSPNLILLNQTPLISKPEFQALKKHLENYFKDCLNPLPNFHPDKSKYWKQSLYTSLQKLLNECIYTINSKQQSEYLMKVYEWYNSKVGHVAQPKPQKVNSVFPNISLLAEPLPKTPNLKKSFLPESLLDDETQSKIDSFFKENRLREIKEKRIQDFTKGTLDRWAASRSRKREEVFRSNESARYASRYSKRENNLELSSVVKASNLFELTDPSMNTTESTEETKDFNREELRKTDKISKLRMLNKRILDYEGFSGQAKSILDYDQDATIIGCYSRGMIKSNLEKLKSRSGNRIKNGFDEIGDIKEKLAKRNLRCGVDILKYGLVLADDLPEKNLTFDSLPSSGSGLLSSIIPKKFVVKKGKK